VDVPVTEELWGETAQPSSLHSHLLSPQGLGVAGTSCSHMYDEQEIPPQLPVLSTQAAAQAL